MKFYRVIPRIRTQEQGCCELVLRLMMSLKTSMWPQDWAQISFRSETLSNCFYSEPDWWLLKGRISRSGDFSRIYRVSNIQDFLFLYWICTAIGFTNLNSHKFLLFNNLLGQNKSYDVRSGWLKPKTILGHPVYYPQIIRSSIFPFCWPSSCLIVKQIR